jgi:hypothetical protein
LQDSPAVRGSILYKLARVFKHLERFLQVDDVNAVAFPKDVLFHLRVPALGLVAKVDTRLKQLLHGDVSQNTSLLNCILRGHPARSGFIPCSAPVVAGGKILVPVINRSTPPSGPQAVEQNQTCPRKTEDGTRPSCWEI